MGREERLERIRYLDGIAKTLEHALIASFITVIGSGLLLEREAALIVAMVTLLSLFMGFHVYRLRRHIEYMWDEIMREDPVWIARSPLYLLALVIGAGVAVLLAKLLLG
ncbi:MAG: hypothetical protein F7B18_02520 [Desulfurococcales archaeon]|nr:hypothetical protein [Desulfurococcales archaeon]